ncbi:hypothetical protein DFA_07797 [Cavenderia fasciculata]|uniref:Ankyrin repeat-containing protein n=1 Tax=Cavenderia fasciculata TaxID=261658 RepID=F4Q3F0_CACFS|nr:uncharacterized protein DFA_07797 [Cavenderia fasciculata]EGG16819.1 hypothetical protein DFA_07797 [Cavenderia fasciculata]|eukprot:XP_004355293.1 hypothetical protein DFA_07797 [Cavenderia fasciculata]
MASQPTSFLHLIGMACSFGRGEMMYNNNNNNNNNNNIVVIRQVFKNRYLLKTIFKHAHQLSLNQLTFGDGIPKLYTYNQLTSIGWMVKNGYISLLRSKINRGDYLKLPKNREKIKTIFCAISDQTLLDKIITLDKWYFCYGQMIPFACASGNVVLLEKILKHELLPKEYLFPLEPYLVLDHAFASGSLDMVRYLDTSVDKCNIAKLEWGIFRFCKTTSSDVVKYFLDRSKERIKVIRVVDSFPLLIASTNPLHPISPYLKGNETFLGQDHILAFINTFVFFKQESWTQVLSSMLYLDKFSSHFPKPLLSIVRDYDRDEKVKEILENNRPFFNRIGDLLVEIGTAKFGNQVAIKMKNATLALKCIDSTHCTYKPLSNALVAIQMFQQRIVLDKKVIADFAILIGVEDFGIAGTFASAINAPHSCLIGNVNGWKVKKAHQIRLHLEGYTSPYTPLCYYVKYAQLDMIKLFLQTATNQEMSSEMTDSSILTSDLASHNIDTAEMVFQAFGKSWDSFFKFNNDHLIPFSRPSSIGNNLFKVVAEKSTLSTNEILEIIVSAGNFKLFDYFCNLYPPLTPLPLQDQDQKPRGIPACHIFIATNQVERLATYLSRLEPKPQIEALCTKYNKLDIINRIDLLK